MNWMPWKLFCLSCVLFLSQVAHPATRSNGTASVSGVLKGDVGSHVLLHLVPTTADPVRYYDGYEAQPKADGTFSFTEIPPGQYRLTIDVGPELSMAPPSNSVRLSPDNERVRQRSKGVTPIFPGDMPSGSIQLHAADQRKGIVITLTHRPSICGHVMRDSGPADTSVVYYRYNSEYGVLDDESKIDTEKDGSYSINDLAPGTYYIGAGYIAPGLGAQAWFPGSASFSQSKSIVVGSTPPEKCNADILLPNNAGGMAALTSISIDGGDKNQRYKAAFLEKNAEGASYFGLTATAYLDKPLSPGIAATGIYATAGTFEAVLYDEGHIGRNIWGDAPTQRVIFDSQMVTLKPAMKPDSQNLVVFTPHTKANIQGELRLDNITRDEFCPNCQSIYVSILREGNGEFQTADLSSANHFDFHNVTPGDYQFFVYTTRPDKVFLKSIIADGQTGQGRHFSVSGPRFVPMVVTLSGEIADAHGHESPDVRHTAHWETEGMRPGASVSGKVIGDEGSVYTIRLLPLIYNNSPDVFTTKTGADGTFHFENVPPGVYRVRAHDKNYLRFDYGGQAPELRGIPVLVNAGAQIKDVTIHAPRHSSICGRVTNENGEPQPGLRIWYRTAADYMGTQYPHPEVSSDAAGYFRIDGLLADDYFLATPRPAAGDFLIGLSADGRISGFTPVRVENGKDVGCGNSPLLEVHVPASTEHYTISGTVAGELPARMGDRFEVELDSAQDLSPYFSQTHRTELSDDHRFRLENIPNGQYRIRVYGLYGSKPKTGSGPMRFSGPYSEPLKHLIASQAVTVTDHDMSELTLSPLTLPTVSGKVAIPQLTAPWNSLKPDDITIALVPHWKNGISTAALKADGNGSATFEIGAVDPGEYELRIESTRGFFVNSVLYFHSVKLNGKEVNPLSIELAGHDPINFQVDLASNAGDKKASVHVHVSGDKAFTAPPPPLGEWCSGYANYQILLLPDSLLSLNEDSQPVQSPRYEIGWSPGVVCEGLKSWAMQIRSGDLENTPPGKYFALALQNRSQIDLGVQGRGRFTRNQRKLWMELAKIATPITLHPGENIELNLDDKTVEAERLVNEVGMPDEQENLRPSNAQSCCSR